MAHMDIVWERRSYSKEAFIEAWNSSSCVAEVCRALGLKSKGGNYETFRLTAVELGLSSDHFTTTYKQGKRVKRDLSEILVYGTRVTGVDLLKRMVSEGLFIRKCYKCDRTEWNDLPIPLELDHIDGDRQNNVIENLMPLCPNCHAQTSTWRGRNARKKEGSSVCRCGNDKKFQAAQCKQCHEKNRTYKIDWPATKTLLDMVEEFGYTGTGRKLGASDNAVKNRITRCRNAVAGSNPAAPTRRKDEVREEV